MSWIIQSRFWVAVAGTALPSAIVFLSVISTLHQARLLHRDYKIGERLSEECGHEYLEAETGRFKVFERFKRGVKGNKPADAVLRKASLLMIIAMGVLITLMVIFLALVFWQVRREAPDDAKTVPTVALALTLGGGLGYMIAFLTVLIHNRRKMRTYEADSAKGRRKERNRMLRMYMPTVIILPLMIWATIMRGEIPAPAWYLGAFGALYVATFVLSFFYQVQYSHIFLINHVEYAVYTEAIQVALNNLGSKFVGENENPVYADVVAYFGNNIRKYTKYPGEDQALFDQYASTLWSYVEHSSKGLELEDIMVKLNAHKEANPVLVAKLEQHIKNVRKNMHGLRALEVYRTRMKKYIRNVLWMLVFIIVIPLYIHFHRSYLEDPTTTVVKYGLIMLFMVFASTWYGWITSAIHL
jgi:ABC-type multidrug transport system fused ATPase/permease subunit